MAANNGEEKLVIDMGTILFEQGDMGGDLYFIQDGQIEIYTVKNNNEVVLATMRPGEVIGLLSSFTREPRMASARALTTCIIRKVSYGSMSGLIKTLPAWMLVVLKEFKIRISQMNKLYSEACQRIRDIEANEISLLFIGTQLARAIAASAEANKVVLEEVEAILPETMITCLEDLLGYSQQEIQKVFDIFVEAGMIKLLIEKEKKRKYFTVANALKVKGFSDFAREAQQGKGRKLVRAAFTHKETRQLAALVRYCVAMQVNLQSTVTLLGKDLQAGLQRVTGQDYDASVLALAPGLALLTLAGESPDESLSFVPASLSSTLTHLSAYQLLVKKADRTNPNGDAT